MPLFLVNSELDELNFFARRKLKKNSESSLDEQKSETLTFRKRFRSSTKVGKRQSKKEITKLQIKISNLIFYIFLHFYAQ